jgi:hypothetical protein
MHDWKNKAVTLAHALPPSLGSYGGQAWFRPMRLM